MPNLPARRAERQHEHEVFEAFNASPEHVPSDPLHGEAVAVRAQQPRYHALLVVCDLHAIDRVLITALQFAHGPVMIFFKNGQRLPRLLLEHERRERLH